MKEIYIGSSLYPTDVDGKVTLPDYPSDFYTTSQADSIFATQTALGVVTGKIPSAASSSNQLADKAFVNSSIATATATFRGTNTTATTEAAFLTWANGLTHSLNDYVFWKTTDSVGNVVFKRYKYGYDETETGTLAWRYEYDLNNSSFTSDQWNAINSGVTSSNWVKTADIKTLTFGSGTTSLVYTPNSGNSRSLLAGSHLSFSISGNNATLNVSDVADSPSASAISTGTSLVSERDVYYGLPTINNAHNYNSNTTIYAPTGGGTANQYLKSAGATSTPVWASFTAGAMSWTEATVSTSTPTLNITTNLGESLTAAIPAAKAVTENNITTYYSGVVTTGAQTFKGIKSFDDFIYANAGVSIWTDLTYYNDRTPRQDVSIQAIDYPILGTEESQKRKGFSFYSYENSPSQTPPSTGIGGFAPMMFGVSGNSEDQSGLFFTGLKDYSGTDFSNYWGINTFNPQYRLHVNGSFGTNGSTMLAINSGNVGIGTTSPDSKLHVSGTAHVTGNATFDGHAILSKAKFVMSDSSAGNYNILIGINALNELLIGYGRTVNNAAQPIDYSTKIYGTNLFLYYGANRTLGTTLDSNGILTNVKSIQSTGGGVAAMGISDLALSGGGGGSGTVKTITVNDNTNKIEADADGNTNLYVALSGDTTNAIQLTLGGSSQSTRSTVSLSAANLRSYLNIDEKSAYVTNIGTSGNTLTWSKGGVAQTAITVPYATNAGTLGGTAKGDLLTTFSSASGDSPDTTVTVGGNSLTAKINADTVDGVQLWTFYKRGFVNSAESEAPTSGWYCVGQVEKSKSSNQYGVISLSVATQTAQRYGTLNIRYSYTADAASATYLVAEWSSACGIDASKFVVTQKTTDTSIIFKLYVNSARGEGWAFSKIDEFRYGFIVNDWTFNNVYSQSALNAIPADEAQTESVIVDINNKAADSAKLNGQPASYYATAENYLPLTGGTMTLASIGSLTLQRNHATYGAYIQFANNTGVLGCIGVSGVDSPVFRNTNNTNYSLWHAGNAYLTLNPDADATTDDFKLTIGSNEVTVGPIPSSTIEALS